MEPPKPFDPDVPSHPDPEAPLSGPPEPWAFLPQPLRRDGPPWWMTEMIAAEPALAGRVLRRLGARLVASGAPRVPAIPETPGRDTPAGRIAAAIRAALEAGEPVIVTGCGTSEHGAQAFAEIVAEAALRARIRGSAHPGAVLARQAFEAALSPQRGGVIIGISHEGGTEATLDALRAAAVRRARTVAVTVSAASPIGILARDVAATGEIDRSWCHTVGYLSPILAAAAVGAAITGVGRDADPVAIRDLLSAGAGRGSIAGEAAAHVGATDALAGALAGCRQLVVLASGVDRTAARELALKIEEATWLPATMRDLETFLHGHIPATDESTALLLVLVDRAGREARSSRASQALAAAGRVGVRAGAILAADLDREWPAFLAPAGRVLVPEAPQLPAPVAALVGTATPLQLLVERMARARGTNPDPIRRDQLAYREAAALVE